MHKAENISKITNQFSLENVLNVPDKITHLLDKRDILVLGNANVKRVSSKKSLVNNPDSTIKYVYFLKKGVIKISNVVENGDELIKYFIKAGTIFGELNLVDNGENSQVVGIPLEESEVWFIPIETVKKIMNYNKVFRKTIFQIMGKRIKIIEHRMLSLMLKDVKERILDFLEELVLEFGCPSKNGYTVRNFLTHNEIAKVTSTSRQSVTTSIGYFKKHGLIDYDSQKLSVFTLKQY